MNEPPSDRPPRAARRAVALCFLFNGILIASWISRIPAIQTRLGLANGALGLALLCLGLGAMLAMPAAGWCDARFGSHRVTQVCGAVYCLLLPVLAFAPTTPLLAVALFCFGGVHGGFDIAMNAQAVAVEERYGRPIMSSFHALWSLGALIGASLGAGMAAWGITPPVHFALAALLGGVGCALTFPHLIATRPPAAAAQPRRCALPPRRLFALGVLAFCVMMGEGAMADWSAVFLREVAHASEALAASGYAAFAVAMAAARFAGDWLTTRLGSVRLLRYSGTLAAAGLLLALLVPHPALVLLGFAAVGAGFATVVPVIFSAAGRLAGEDPGAALATTTTLGYTGFLIGPPFIGFAAELIGLRGALGLIVVTSVSLLVLARNAGPSQVTHQRRKPAAESGLASASC